MNDERRVEDARRALGECGEQAAADYLEREGWYVVARNWRRANGELDIIASREIERYGEACWLVAIVEVKTRRAGARLAPELSVTRRKRLKIVELAKCWRAQQTRVAPEKLAIRFDVIAVEIADDGANVRHIEGAFDELGRLL